MHLSQRALWLALLPGFWIVTTLSIIILFPSISQSEPTRKIGAAVMFSYLLVAPISILVSIVSFTIALRRSFSDRFYIPLAFFHMLILLGSAFALFVLFSIPRINLM